MPFCQPARPDAAGRRRAARRPASVTPAALPATPDDAPAPPAELADFGRAGWPLRCAGGLWRRSARCAGRRPRVRTATAPGRITSWRKTARWAAAAAHRRRRPAAAAGAGRRCRWRAPLACRAKMACACCWPTAATAPAPAAASAPSYYFLEGDIPRLYAQPAAASHPGQHSGRWMCRRCAGFSHPGRAGERQAADLAGQCRHHAQAAVGD